MEMRGKVWKFGNDIDTDVIIPARYLNTSLAEELAKHCMEDASPGFFGRIAKGDIIIAGKNFGCGSSREHAPIAIKACGISCVIAESFARIFYRNSINIGLPILEVPDACDEISEGDELRVDIHSGLVENLTTGKTYQANSFPEFMGKIMASGGLIEYVRDKVR